MKITNNIQSRRSVFALISVGTPFATRGNVFMKVEPIVDKNFDVRNALNLNTGKFVSVSDSCEVELINAELKIS